MLTIFSTPKPVKGLTAIQQTNAIESWKRLDVEIMLLGAKTSDWPHRDNARFVPNVPCGPGGLPYVSGLFWSAERMASNDLLVYANADIIFLPDLLSAVQRVADRFDRFLMVGQRWDVEIDGPVADYSEQELRSIIHQGKWHSVSGKDWFAFRRPLGLEFPPFVIGRVMWDNWLLNAALEAGIPVVDATACVTAIHQEHGYPDGWLYDEGAEYNRGLCDVPPNMGRISEADWEMNDETIVPRRVA